MMENVVASKDGTGPRCGPRLHGLRARPAPLASRTTTASPGTRPAHYVSSFAGFVPAENPQLSIIVVIDEPSTSIFASVVSAPVFAELATYALRQLRIAPAAALPAGATDVTPDVAAGTAPTPTDIADAGPAPAPTTYLDRRVTVVDHSVSAMDLARLLDESRGLAVVRRGR